MIYLDANAFYWYLGREQLFTQPSVPKFDVKKLCDFLDSRKDKSIPASVFMEMIVHFRDNPDAVKKIIKFLEDNNLKILNNLQDYCFTQDELTSLQLTTSNVVLKQYAYKLLDKKIKIEVKHTCAFLKIISLLYANHYLKTSHSLDAKTQSNVLSYLGKNVTNAFHEDYLSQLTSELQNGYADNNKSQQYLKKKYIDLLVQNCIIFQTIIDTMVKYLEGEKDLYAVMCKAATDAKNNGFTDNEIMKSIVTALNTDSPFLKFAENEIPSIFQKKGYSKHQADYLKSMLEAWLERGQKLIKNDIFDMLCVGVLDKLEKNPELNILIDQSPYLISFDETMMDFLRNNSKNTKLLNKFLLPQYSLT